MATENLLVRLKMDAGQYRREARQASTATSQVGDSAKQASTRFDGLRAGIRKIGPAASIAGLAATAAIGKFTADSIRDASNLQESINAINVTFGEAADGVHDLGEESAESFGLSRRAFNEFATRFSAFGREISEGTGRDVVDIVEEITGRVADFASVHNLSMERAAEVTQSTLAGETEVFRRFGGDVSAATVEMRLLEEGIISQGEAASEQEKILGRYLEFMDQTANTAGDFANTSDDLANKQRTFSAALEDTRAEVGEELLPVMTDLLDVGEDLIPVLVDLGKFIGLVGRGLAIALAGSDFERLETQIGGAADNAAGLATAIVELDRTAGTAAEIRELPERIRDFIDEADLTPDAIRTVIDNMDFLTDTMGLSEDAAAAIAAILREELSESMYETRDAALTSREEISRLDGGLTDAEQAARDFFNTSGDLAGELDDQGGRWDDVVDSMEDYEDMLRRLTDPVFRALDDQRNLDEAQRKWNEAVDEFGEKSPEAIEAGFDLAEAQAEVNANAQELPDNLQPGIDHVINLGIQAGITDGTLQGMAGTLDGLDGRKIDIELAIRRTGAPIDPNAIIGAETGFDPGFLRHSGGRVEAGQPYVWQPKDEMLITAGGGLVTSRSDTDRIISALERFGGGSTSTNNYNIPVQSTGDANTDAQLVGSIASVLRRMETI